MWNLTPNLYVFDLHIFRVSRRDSFCCSRNLKQLSPENVQIFQVQLLKKFCLVYFDMDKFFDIIAVFLRLISNLSLETFFRLKVELNDWISKLSIFLYEPEGFKLLLFWCERLFFVLKKFEKTGNKNFNPFE